MAYLAVVVQRRDGGWRHEALPCPVGGSFWCSLSPPEFAGWADASVRERGPHVSVAFGAEARVVELSEGAVVVSLPDAEALVAGVQLSASQSSPGQSSAPELPGPCRPFEVQNMCGCAWGEVDLERLRPVRQTWMGRHVLYSRYGTFAISRQRVDFKGVRSAQALEEGLRALGVGGPAIVSTVVLEGCLGSLVELREEHCLLGQAAARGGWAVPSYGADALNEMPTLHLAVEAACPGLLASTGLSVTRKGWVCMRAQLKAGPEALEAVLGLADRLLARMRGVVAGTGAAAGADI